MYRTVLWTLGEGEGGKIWENDIETHKISCKKRDASPGSMHDTGCLGLVQKKKKQNRERLSFRMHEGIIIRSILCLLDLGPF